MNHNIQAASAADSGKRHAADVCWSSEWSFIEDAHAASKKQAKPPVVKKQPAGNHAADGRPL